MRLLQVAVRNSEITANKSYGAAFDQAASATTERAEIALTANCLFGNAKADVEATRYAVGADGNWWGGASARTAASQGGSVSAGRSVPGRTAAGVQTVVQ